MFSLSQSLNYFMPWQAINEHSYNCFILIIDLVYIVVIRDCRTFVDFLTKKEHLITTPHTACLQADSANSQIWLGLWNKSLQSIGLPTQQSTDINTIVQI